MNKVDLFIPCCIDQLYPQTAFSTIKVLEKLGVEVNYVPEPLCCGQTAFKNGYWEEAKDIGEKFIESFSSGNPVVCPSASCVSFVKNYYWKMFYNAGLHVEYRKLRDKIYELTDYIVNVLRVVKVDAYFPHKVTWHDSCAALREYGLIEEPRLLLKNVAGLELIEMEKTDQCCGFGGAFSLGFEPISTAMTARKIDNALATGAEYIVSTDSTCLGNMEAYIKKQKLNIKCIHIADVLASEPEDAVVETAADSIQAAEGQIQNKQD